MTDGRDDIDKMQNKTPGSEAVEPTPESMAPESETDDEALDHEDVGGEDAEDGDFEDEDGEYDDDYEDDEDAPRGQPISVLPPLPTMPDHPRCGFIALVGAPNAGKSTLLNAMIGSKVSIVSPKVQTTRTRVLGITIQGDAQMIFVDTPGIFKPKRRLDRAMVAAAWQGAEDADVIGVLYDVSLRSIDEDTRSIVARL